MKQIIHKSFFNLCVIFLFLIFFTLSCQFKTDKKTATPNVLGRTVRLDAICDNFEDENWHYNYQKHECYRKFWQPGDRGEPELLTRVDTPNNGKRGSLGALEICTNDNNDDSVPSQEDLKTVEFNSKLGQNLTRAYQPVFVVHVWLPTFDQWPKGYCFGFRHEARSKDISEYYPSIWMYNPSTVSETGSNNPYFVFRIGTGRPNDVHDGPIKCSGWWTLAIAFDEEGIGYYYACPGVNIPTERNKIFDTTQFQTINGINNPTMDYVGYSFFSLGYPTGTKAIPRLVIDDYEVWVVSREGLK